MNLRKKLDLDSSIGLYVKLTEKSLERAIDYKMKEKFGLAGTHWKIILILAIKDGLNQRELADLAFVESPTIVPILDRMENLGLVFRKNDPHDRRTNRLFLTAKSKKLAQQITISIIDFRRQVTNKISKKDLMISHKVLKQLTLNADNLLKEKGQRIPETILNKV